MNAPDQELKMRLHFYTPIIGSLIITEEKDDKVLKSRIAMDLEYLTLKQVYCRIAREELQNFPVGKPCTITFFHNNKWIESVGYAMAHSEESLAGRPGQKVILQLMLADKHSSYRQIFQFYNTNMIERTRKERELQTELANNYETHDIRMFSVMRQVNGKK